VIADAAICAGWDAVQFFDDHFPQVESSGPWPVAGTRADLAVRVASFDGVIVAIGNNAARAAVHRVLAETGARMTTIIHPRATISSYAKIGVGSFVAPGAIINVGADLGAATVVNTGATVDHDCRLGTAVHVAPGAHLSGGVEIGDRSWIGVGAAVREGIRIGADAMVGAGAAVVNDVADGATVIGVPARAME
jgi:sugar O-acyltransferase (sialic acid O-acetyltransferase NeuD family)